jgi:Pel9A-like, right handed beta helix region
MRWRSLSSCLVAAIALAIASQASGAEYFVATNGSDSNPGTLALPFASITRGQQAATAGDTVWLRGGTYQYTAGLGAPANAVLFNKSGTSTKPINYFAYPGEKPVFDFFNYLPQERIRGFSVRADWLHFRGIELKGVQQTITNVNESWGIRVENGADNNIFEQLDLHNNEGPGFFIVNGGNNLVLNCDSHDNYDPDRGGENADGFGSHSSDNGNMFVGNRAWNNSDDGYDCINSRGQVKFINSWSWRNGWIPGTSTGAGNGAGFKAGGFGLDSTTFPTPPNVPTNLVEDCLSFSNRTQGFYANHHPGGIDFINNTAYGNPRGFDLTNDVMPDTWPADHYLRNNVAYGNSTNLANANQTLIDDEFNTWNLRAGAVAADFLSLSSLGMNGPRQADGSLPELDFMRLAATSQLIDGGMDVGLPFFGLAPDMGAFEFGMPGDFNNDGLVDAADYTVWRDHLGSVFTSAEYETWRMYFGSTSSGGGALAGVPEPEARWMFGFALTCWSVFGNRSRVFRRI